jgi:hypothetical protein
MSTQQELDWERVEFKRQLHTITTRNRSQTRTFFAVL